MPLDPYSPCPGGTGKKIKFCCHELLGDLEQLDRLVEGEQIQAALEQVVRLSDKHPGKACLLATRTKLELAAKKFNDAAVTSRAFLEAYPDNPLALGHAAVTAALNDNMQEAASLFDRAREAAGDEIPDDLTRIAMTLVQVASQVGQFGLAESTIEWLTEKSLGSEEERGILAETFLSSGPPPALRIRVPLAVTPDASPWRFEFDTALKHAGSWKLSKALKTFNSLKGVAGDDAALFTNIALLCERLARPLEAAEAWLKVAELRASSEDPAAPDEAVEATGRAVVLESQANPERSPVIRYKVLRAGLDGDLDLLEDALRKNDHFEASPVDRSRWVSRGAVPPRSSWRVYGDAEGDGTGQRLLASILIHGKQTDRDAEVTLQGLAPDVTEAKPLVEAPLHCSLEEAEQPLGLPSATPMNYLAGAQYKLVPPPPPTSPPAAGEDAPIDTLLAEQQASVAKRFITRWADTALPELLGKTPRDAVAAGGEPQRRVEAIVNDAEATEMIPAGRDIWPELRTAVGLPAPSLIESATPLGDLPPQRWLRLNFAKVELDHLRGMLLAAADIGYSLTAERVAEALLSQDGISDPDRWQALGVLEARARTTTRRLEILTQIRGLAKTMQADEGMLDVAELRIQLQRGDQPAFMQVMERIRRLHGQNPRVANGVAQVLMEAGIDVNALAAASAAGMPPAAGGVPAGPATAAPAAQPGKLWTPGSESAGGGEKPAIWTP
ncbi:MAG: tetratricopeptide repeat protein [Pirellulales bacterium]|jgi:tetratricopeptide (TPR) repeat protein